MYGKNPIHVGNQGLYGYRLHVQREFNVDPLCLTVGLGGKATHFRPCKHTMSQLQAFVRVQWMVTRKRHIVIVDVCYLSSL